MEIVEQQTITDQPKEIYDLDSGKMVANPDLKGKNQKEEEEEESEEEKPVAKAKAKESEKESQDEEEEEPEEEGSEEEESEEESGEEEAEEEEEEADDNVEEYSSVDELIEKKFSNFNVKSVSELTELVEGAIETMDELKNVTKERDELKYAGPKFADATQESAYKFVSKFDTKMQGEALQTFAKLIGMDIETADGKMLLEEKYIHENPHYTRSEAQRMFTKQYNRTYVLDRAKFDGTDEDFAQEHEDLKILLKGDEAKARTYLKEQREKHKPAEAEAPKKNEAITKAIEQNAKTYSEFVQKTGEISFGEGENKFVFKLDDNRKKQVSAIMNNWVGNPTSYDDNGKLIGAESPEKMLKAAIGGSFLDEIVKAAYDSAGSKVKVKRIDELDGKKPKKRAAPASGEGMRNSDDLDEQARMLIRKKKAA